MIFGNQANPTAHHRTRIVLTDLWVDNDGTISFQAGILHSTLTQPDGNPEPVGTAHLTAQEWHTLTDLITLAQTAHNTP